MLYNHFSMENSIQESRPVTLIDVVRGPKAGVRLQSFLWVIAIGSIVIDQATKWWIEGNLLIGDSIFPFPAIAHIFQLIHVINKGAAFGAFQGFGWLFSIVAFFVAAMILGYNSIILEKATSFRLAMGLILGGALGNVIDRIRLGWVTDFFHFNLLPLVENYPALQFRYLNWPVFNFADVFIFSGVCILITLMWRDQLPEDPWTEEELAARALRENAGNGAPVLQTAAAGAAAVKRIVVPPTSVEDDGQSARPGPSPTRQSERRSSETALVSPSPAAAFALRAVLVIGGGLVGMLLIGVRSLFRPRTGRTIRAISSTDTISADKLVDPEPETRGIIDVATTLETVVDLARALNFQDVKKEIIEPEPSTMTLHVEEQAEAKLSDLLSDDHTETTQHHILLDQTETVEDEADIFVTTAPLDGPDAQMESEMPEESADADVVDFDTVVDDLSELLSLVEPDDAVALVRPSSRREWGLLLSGLLFLGWAIFLIRSRDSRDQNR